MLDVMHADCVSCAPCECNVCAAARPVLATYVRMWAIVRPMCRHEWGMVYDQMGKWSNYKIEVVIRSLWDPTFKIGKIFPSSSSTIFQFLVVYSGEKKMCLQDENHSPELYKLRRILSSAETIIPLISSWTRGFKKIFGFVFPSVYDS